MWRFSLFLFAILALGQTSLAYNCSVIEVDRIKFDLSSLNKTEEISQIEETPPTIMNTTYLINPCAPLTYDEKQVDRCESGTYICQIIINYLKDSDNEPKDPRTISIKPVASEKVEPLITLGSALNDGDTHGNLSIILSGGFYNGEPQQANITFICVDERNKITPTNYKENTLFIEWETIAACGKYIPEEDKGMSGFTKFIIILILIGLCYFGLGAAYNYHVYKAHGWDLLPHLDFWRDFPYLISDFFKYLVNLVRTGRGGYTRV